MGVNVCFLMQHVYGREFMQHVYGRECVSATRLWA